MRWRGRPTQRRRGVRLWASCVPLWWLGCRGAAGSRSADPHMCHTLAGSRLFPVPRSDGVHDVVGYARPVDIALVKSACRTRGGAVDGHRTGRVRTPGAALTWRTTWRSGSCAAGLTRRTRCRTPTSGPIAPFTTSRVKTSARGEDRAQHRRLSDHKRASNIISFDAAISDGVGGEPGAVSACGRVGPRPRRDPLERAKQALLKEALAELAPIYREVIVLREIEARPTARSPMYRRAHWHRHNARRAPGASCANA